MSSENFRWRHRYQSIDALFVVFVLSLPASTTSGVRLYMRFRRIWLGQKVASIKFLHAVII